MPWYGVALVVALALNAIANIAYVGKPRKPIEPEAAAAVVILNGLMIWAVVALSQ